MLKQITISNFTAFSKATFGFSPGLNVIVGANGTGKTHVLKLGYLFTRAWSDLSNQRVLPTGKRAEAYFENQTEKNPARNRPASVPWKRRRSDS